MKLSLILLQVALFALNAHAAPVDAGTIIATERRGEAITADTDLFLHIYDLHKREETDAADTDLFLYAYRDKREETGIADTDVFLYTYRDSDKEAA